MQIKYRYYKGGKENPFEAEVSKAYEQLTREREVADPSNEKGFEEICPRLSGWAEYVIANSKSVFWQMERALSQDEEAKSYEIGELWEEAKTNGCIGEWLKEAEGEEVIKAQCFYMAMLHRQFCPGDITVDFRYYVKGIGTSEVFGGGQGRSS